MEPILRSRDQIRWFEAACRRVSTRRYGSAPTSEQINVLAALAETLSFGGVRTVLLRNASDVFGRGLMGRKLKGVKQGAGFILSPDTPGWCAGYVGEAFILECTALELGTCWMRSAYRRKSARVGAGLRGRERLAAVTPIGAPVSEMFTPLSDDDRQRKSIPKLTGLLDRDFENLPKWQREAVLCARGAPSAKNRQPWLFDLKTDGFLLHSDKDSLDTGIAMFHLELGAAVHGKYGRWSEVKDGWRFRVGAP